MLVIMKAAFAAIVTGVVLFITVQSVMADEYDFQFTSLDPGVLDGSGTFDVVGGNVKSVSAVFNTNNANNRGEYTVGNVSPGSIFHYESYINAGFTAAGRVNTYQFQLENSNNTGGKFGDQVQGTFTYYGQKEVSEVGYFSTTPVGQSGGGSSGNAPSSEVNTILGLLLVGCTVAFLRRQRGDEALSA